MRNITESPVKFFVDFNEKKVFIEGIYSKLKIETDLETLKKYVKNNELKLDDFILEPFDLISGKSLISEENMLYIVFNKSFEKFIEENSVSKIVIPVFSGLGLNFYNFKSNVLFKTKQYKTLSKLEMQIDEESAFDYKNLFGKILNNKMELNKLYISNMDLNKNINLDLSRLNFEKNTDVRVELKGLNKLENKNNINNNVRFLKFSLEKIKNLEINLTKNIRISNLYLFDVGSEKELEFHSIGKARISYSFFKTIKFNKVENLKMFRNNIDKLEINNSRFIDLSYDNGINILVAKNNNFVYLNTNNTIDKIKFQNNKSLELSIGDLENKIKETFVKSRDNKNLIVILKEDLIPNMLSSNGKFKLTVFQKILSLINKFDFDNIEFINEEEKPAFDEEYNNLIHNVVKLYKNNNNNKFEDKLLEIIFKYNNYLDKEDLKLFKKTAEYKKNNLSEKMGIQLISI